MGFPLRLSLIHIYTNKLDVHYVKAALDTCKGKIKTFSELPAYAGFYFTDQVEYDAEAAKKDFVPENKPRLEKLRDAFTHAPAFNAESLEAALKETAKTLGVKAGVLVHPCRLAVTGKPSGPSLYHLLDVYKRQAQMIFAADDVRDVHLQIVNDIDEVEHGLAVGALDDEVGIHFLSVGQFADDVADDEVVDGDGFCLLYTSRCV